MKTLRVVAVMLVAGLLLNFNSQAQTEVQFDQAEAAAVLAAELTPLAEEEIPWAGTFYVLTDSPTAARRLLAPLPCPPVRGVVYSTSRPNVFLVDGRAAARVDAELMKAMVSLRVQFAAATLAVERTQLAAADGVMAKASQDGQMSLNERDSGGLAFAAPDYGSNMFLEITGVGNGVASFNLRNATNQVYEIRSKTNLSLGVWNTELPVWPTNQAVMPFTLPMLDRTNALFVWARDWTGVDENANIIPDWWEWSHFGNLAQTGGEDYDGDGTSNYEEYLNGTDPNTIVFTVRFDSFRVRTNPAGAFSISSGVPAFMGVLVDNTNFADASWTPYSSTFSLDLGSTDGTRKVWLSLKGRAGTSQASLWRQFELTRDTTPPLIILTNPVSATFSQTVIQLQGYSPERLSSLRCDVTNTSGLQTNLQGYVTTQWFDTNLFELTTNWFECPDIELAEGTNSVVLSATDLAGNISRCAYSFILDYSIVTNPSAIKLLWPQDGTQISGSTFTCRGWVDDPTATVFCSLSSTNGQTNAVGLVERNGNFWVENLPLAGGTNSLAITVTNSAGWTSTTNFSVVKSDVVLTMHPLSGPDLWLPAIDTSGTISDTSYAVWVNGVQATVHSDGTWNASNVPVNDGGTASFVITAYAPGEMQPSGGSGGGSQ